MMIPFTKLYQTTKSHTLQMLLSACVLSLLLSACETPQEKSERLAGQKLEQIELQMSTGNYQAMLDSIRKLREAYPKAVNARKKALALWQEVSLRKARKDVSTTDSLLQIATKQMEQCAPGLQKNLLKARCDSLEARYEVYCTIVRTIVKRQSEK